MKKRVRKLELAKKPNEKKWRKSYKADSKGTPTIESMWKISTGGRDKIPDYVRDKFLKIQRKRDKQRKKLMKSRAKVNLNQVVQEFYDTQE